jgi:hypothetical protein
MFGFGNRADSLQSRFENGDNLSDRELRDLYNHLADQGTKAAHGRDGAGQATNAALGRAVVDALLRRK